MSLPILECPEYKCKLPITGTEVTYRPFKVKEQKILLLAATNEEASKQTLNDIVDSLSGVLKACTFNKVDINNLCSIDFEYLFIKIKSAARGSIEPQLYTCKSKDSTGKICGQDIELDIDFDEIKLNGKIQDNNIKISDDLMIVTKMPTFKMLKEIEDTKDELDIVASLIDIIIYKGESFTDFTKEEAADFIEQFTEDQIAPLAKYFKEIPELSYKKKIKCNKCGTVHDIEVKGLQNFFE